jgi:hypothetical protein
MSAGPIVPELTLPTNSPITERMVSDYCRKRIAPHLLPVHTEALRKFLIAAVDTGAGIPKYAGRYDWQSMSMITNVPHDMLVGAGRHIVPLLDAIGRSARTSTKRSSVETPAAAKPPAAKSDPAPRRSLDVTDRANRVLSGAVEPQAKPAEEAPKIVRPKRQYHRRPVVEFPEPLWTEWDDVDGFRRCLEPAYQAPWRQRSSSLPCRGPRRPSDQPSNPDEVGDGRSGATIHPKPRGVGQDRAPVSAARGILQGKAALSGPCPDRACVGGLLAGGAAALGVGICRTISTKGPPPTRTRSSTG